MNDTTELRIPPDALVVLATAFLSELGCTEGVAAEVGAHLVDSNLKGVSSHGVVRLPQYLAQARKGEFNPAGEPTAEADDRGVTRVRGNGGFGMPAMRLAVELGVADARDRGVSAIGVTDCSHTGRIGAYAEQAAAAGCLSIIFGGGGRHGWPQVTPYGGARAILSTNPFSFGIPGGEDGPVVIDFATSVAAHGRVLAAKSAGRPVTEGIIVDRDGRPSTDPEDFYRGGALLPAAGPKGYGMALFAELVADALLGPTHELNWLALVLDTGHFAAASAYRGAAEEILAELRTCPPAPGFDRVEVPGERERRIEAEQRRLGVTLPQPTWDGIVAAAAELGLDADSYIQRS